MEKLCDDISSEIFIRLRSKNIAQLRCVCKRWNTLLRGARFIKSHLRRSNNDDKDEILLLRNHGYGGFPFQARSSVSPDVDLIDLIKFPVNFPSEEAQRRKIVVIGAANGLVCFSIGYDDDLVIHVWNPSLSALLTVPPYTISVPSRNPGSQLYYAYCFFRFGFDPKNDDYKILKVIKVKHIKHGVEWLQVEVYSMRSGCWKLITQRFPSGVSNCYRNLLPVCVDGYLHWLCSNEDSNMETIVAYDLAAESFSEISLPDHTNIGDYDYLGVFDGKLCVISCVRGVGYDQVYVLDQYGSWVDGGFSLSHLNKDDITPYGFTLKNNFIYEDCNSVMNLFNPAAAAPFNKVKPFYKGYTSNSIIIPYVESLVWVTPPRPTC